MVELAQPPHMPLSFYLIAGGVGDYVTACLKNPIDTLEVVRSQLKGEMSNVKRQQGVRAMFNDAISITKLKRGFFGHFYTMVYLPRV